MNLLFATAEYTPIVSTGGLGAASAGLVAALRERGHEVTVCLPDYGHYELQEEHEIVLPVPDWVGEARVRSGTHPLGGRVDLIASPSLARPHPYVNPESHRGWDDNDHRFFAFSCAVASYAKILQPDLVHLNDWHTATALAHLEPHTPSVFSIHNLAHQGWADIGWMLPLEHRHEFEFHGSVNAMAGAIRAATRVVAVSPNYADEIRTDLAGLGLAAVLRERGAALHGILNGIDTTEWNPQTDPHIAAQFTTSSIKPKRIVRDALIDELGLVDDGPLFVVVSRLDHQKAIEVVLNIADIFETLPATLAILGSGEVSIEDFAHHVSTQYPHRISFRHGYDAAFAHRLFAAGDFTVIPSRFEPCGLTQMQAMRYGTVPVVTRVGGLADTVIDIDVSPEDGNGIVARSCDEVALTDAIHRAHRLWLSRGRYRRTQRRGMSRDWSWSEPAKHYENLYQEAIEHR